jgi:hypothetical protein
MKRLIVVKIPAQTVRVEFPVDSDDPSDVAIEDANRIASIFNGSLNYQVMEQRFIKPIVNDMSEVEKLRDMVRRLLDDFPLRHLGMSEQLRKEAEALVSVDMIGDEEDDTPNEWLADLMKRSAPQGDTVYVACSTCNICHMSYPSDEQHVCSTTGDAL